MSIEDKQARSVFVENIPHGTTEEQIKEYFSTVGTLLSFRIAYDKEACNPKDYGFAEYLNTGMAQAAIDNLDGRNFNGSVLRVNKASSQADELRMIHQQSSENALEAARNVEPMTICLALTEESGKEARFKQILRQLKIQPIGSEGQITLDCRNPEQAEKIVKAIRTFHAPDDSNEKITVWKRIKCIARTLIHEAFLFLIWALGYLILTVVALTKKDYKSGSLNGLVVILYTGCAALVISYVKRESRRCREFKKYIEIFLVYYCTGLAIGNCNYFN